METVLVYNAGGSQALHEVSLRHAIGMLSRGVARVLEAVPGEVFGPYPLPRSLELVHWIYTKWMYQATGRMPYSKEGVLRRDRHRCAYCGRTATTVDHVLPRSRGGRSSWTNCVASCVQCNSRKANRTPAEARMRLQWEPHQPKSPADLIPRHQLA